MLQIAVCLTATGRVIALQLDTGFIKWSRLLPLKGSSYKLVVTRSYPSGSRCPSEIALFFSAQENGDRTVKAIYFDATDGSQRSSKEEWLYNKIDSFPINGSKPFQILHLPVLAPSRISRDSSTDHGKDLFHQSAGTTVAPGTTVAKAKASHSIMIITGSRLSNKVSKRFNNDIIACAVIPPSALSSNIQDSILSSSPSPSEQKKKISSSILGDKIAIEIALNSSNHAGHNLIHALNSEHGFLETRIINSVRLPLEFPSSPLCYGSSAIGRVFYADKSGSSNIVGVAYPNTDDVSNSPAQILGDDSLLIKYLNHNLVAILSESLSPPMESSSTSWSGKIPVPTVDVTLVDTVAGRILHRVSHSHATISPPSFQHDSLYVESQAAPKIIISENWVIYTYWNAGKAKRTEVGVLALYEGMMGPFDLNPFKVPLQDPIFSSFSKKPPVVMQRTFIFPKTVEAISASVTANGIATKNPMFLLQSGQIAVLPRRLLEPRRPSGTPSKTEQQEGLFQYHPLLLPDGRYYASLNQTILGLQVNARYAFMKCYT